MRKVKITVGHVALLVSASALGVVSSSLVTVRRESKLLSDKYTAFQSFATNVYAYLYRVDALEKAVSQGLSVSSSSLQVSDQTSADVIKSTGVIPYSYFRAQGYRGISDGQHYAIVGQKTRFGVLTDCGRDYAEFDGRTLMGLGGSNE